MFQCVVFVAMLIMKIHCNCSHGGFLSGLGGPLWFVVEVSIAWDGGGGKYTRNII